MWRLLRSRWLFWTAFAALALWATLSVIEIRAGDPRESAPADRIAGLREDPNTNVLFVLIDTLRAHRVSSYGYARETSPTLDYLASRGVRFAHHLAQSSWTKCSMASLWTGLYPARTGVLRSEHATPPEATLPAEIFRQAGFRTAGIWRNGWVSNNFGFGQGFEVYERPVPKPPSVRVRRENPHITLEGTDHDVVDAAIEFLRVHGRERWFLYVHLMDVHQYLYDDESALFGSSYADVYDNAIRHTDAAVGRLLAHLAERDLLQKTLVAIGSDHGEAFSERGYEGHAKLVDRETTEVPFILGLPFQLEAGVVVDARTRNIDIWPTILDLLGLPALPDTDGRSLVPQILAAARGEPAREAPPAVAHIDQGWGRRNNPQLPAVSVVDGSFRFVQLQQADAGVLEELYDSEVDPLERKSVLAERPEVAARLRGLAAEYLASRPAPWGVATPSVDIDEMELNQLRALGYAVP